MSDYKHRKYKKKYLKLKKYINQIGGFDNTPSEPMIHNKGFHVILDYSNLVSSETSEVLTNNIVKILEETVKVAELNVLDRSINVLGKNTGTPPGFAITYTLDQSHMTAHCYSNLGILAVDIFTCGDISKGKKAGEYFMKEIKMVYPMIALRSKHLLKRFYYME